MPTARRPITRWLRLAFVALVLGAATTTAIAWILAATSPTTWRPVDSPLAGAWPADVPPSWPPPTTSERFVHRGAILDRAYAHQPGTMHRSHYLAHLQFGVPMRSLSFDRAQLPPAPGRVRWAIENKGHSFRSLPLRPEWPGFAADTALYAAIWFALLLAPRTLRRALRQRRGLCPACAYPTGASPTCTECGATLYHRGPRSSAPEALRA